MEINEVSTQSWWETMKEKLNPSNLWESIVASKDKLMTIIICFGLGFLSGYLFKKYVHLIVALGLFVLLCVILQSFDIITIFVNGPKVRSLLGIQPTTELNGTLLSLWWQWCKEHLHIVISYAIGFLVGVRLA